MQSVDEITIIQSHFDCIVRPAEGVGSPNIDSE